MASWRDPSGTLVARVGRDAQARDGRRAAAAAGQSGPFGGSAWTARRSQLTWFPAVARA